MWSEREITESFREGMVKKKYRKAPVGWYEGKKVNTKDIFTIRISKKGVEIERD